MELDNDAQCELSLTTHEYRYIWTGWDILRFFLDLAAQIELQEEKTEMQQATG